MISRRFIKTSMMYTLAGTLPMASAIILLPFYIHYLPTNVYGGLSIYLAFSMLLQILITYSFDSSIYLHFHEFKNDPVKLREYISSAFVFLLISGLIVNVITALAGELVFQRVFDDPSISFHPYGWMSALTAVFQAIFKVYSSLLQSRERPVTYFWSNVVCFALIAAFTIVGLELYPGTLVGPVGGRMAASLLSAILALAVIFRETGISFNYKLLRSSFSYNRALFIYQLQMWSMNYLDRMLLILFVSMSEIGVYDFAMKCMLVIDLIIGGLHNSFYPKVLGVIMAQEQKGTTIEVNRYYHGLTGVVMLLVCLSVPGFMVLSDIGLIRAGYEQSIKYLPLIGVIYLVRSMRYYFVMPYGALKYSKPLPWIYIVISLCKIGIILALGNKLGVYAVLIGGIVSVALESVLLRFSVAKRFKYKLNAMKLIAAPVLLAILLFVLSFLYERSYAIQAIVVVLCVGILWWLYRNEIRQIRISKYFGSKQT